MPDMKTFKVSADDHAEIVTILDACGYDTTPNRNGQISRGLVALFRIIPAAIRLAKMAKRAADGETIPEGEALREAESILAALPSQKESEK